MADRDTDVKSFSCDTGTLAEIEEALSRERLRTYLDAAGGDRERALRLYAWNTDVSGAFYGPLQGLEVTLRNAMSRCLAGLYGLAWWDHPEARLDRGALMRIVDARSKLARSGHRNDTSRIVATLSFGFWVSLLGPGGHIESGQKANYEMTLWRPALRQAFPYRDTLTRRQAHGPLNGIRELRNRIAHHEPIFTRDLAGDHARILDIAGWISPAMRVWIGHQSRVLPLLEVSRGAKEPGF